MLSVAVMEESSGHSSSPSSTSEGVQDVDGADAPVKLGDAVEVAFEDLAAGVAVPAFKLAVPA